jgi:hypothetical protein
MDEESATILLANKQGGFAWLGAHPESRYQGVFFRLKGSVYKAVADLRMAEPLQDVTNHLWGVQRDYGSVSQRITMPHGSNALLVEFSAPASFDLLLDCKLIDDNREWGRNYSVSQEKDCVVIKFLKKNDSRDDNSAAGEFSLYLALCGDKFDFSFAGNWVEQHYPWDEHRGSAPWRRWAFNAGAVRAQRFVLAAGLTKKDALAEARRVLRNRVSLLNKQVQEVSGVIAHKLKIPKSVDLAYECARNSLDSLATADEGLYAGIPWFYQYWVRDEAVSCGALRSIGRKKLVKSILLRHLAKLGKEGIPFAFSGHSLRTVDGPGWVALRYAQNRDLFAAREQKKAEAALRKSFTALTQNLKDGLVANNPLETWMDTGVGGKDVRDGARIEVQALTLALARTLGEKEFEWQLARRVRETFWNGSYLHDGLGDPTIRPNVFIAAYAYPDLLTKSEWEKCFDAVLPKLWLPWGGLSSIDTSHELFTDHYAGQDNVSYHRGDSWFWLNNLAALVMHRVNAKKYRKYIDRILEASSHEITALGALGHHAELSSARALSSHGCQSQAWSAAMFIELCEEVFSQK